MKKILLAIAGGVVAVIAIVLSTLGVQSLLHHEPPAPPPVLAVTPPPAAPEPAPAPVPPPVAQILGIKPHFITVSKEVRQCAPTENVVYVPQHSNAPGAGLVLGGVAGGLAGSAIHGNAHTAAIISGAAIGALTGRQVQKSMNAPEPVVTKEEHCHTYTKQSKVQKGYEVTYWYNGQQAMVIMNSAPIGTTMPVPMGNVVVE